MPSGRAAAVSSTALGMQYAFTSVLTERPLPHAIIGCMSEDERNHESFEEQLRQMAQELGRSVERAVNEVDFEGIAGALGIDPDRAREWAEGAGGWLRAQAEHFGDEMASHAAPAEHRSSESRPAEDSRPASARVGEDPLRSAAPHPLDVPTEDQGRALAALNSGRWTVEPGSNALAGHGDGPSPDDALGLVRELRVRDWISADGEVTAVGRHALHRWLEVAKLR